MTSYSMRVKNRIRSGQTPINQLLYDNFPENNYSCVTACQKSYIVVEKKE